MMIHSIVPLPLYQLLFFLFDTKSRKVLSFVNAVCSPEIMSKQMKLSSYLSIPTTSNQQVRDLQIDI